MPRTSSQLTSRLTPILIGLFAFGLYASTTPMGLTWDLGGADGGEFATAVYTRGLVHSPGYPTYLLFAQLVHLIPISSFAYRLNLFSALCMSLTAALLTHLLQRINHIPHLHPQKEDQPTYLSIVFPSLLFVIGPLVWSQAIITEVYALAAFFCAAILHLGYSLHEQNERFFCTFYLIAFTSGLALGAHYLTALISLFVLLWLIMAPQRPKAVWQARTLWAIPCFVLGLATYIYLPLRAGHIPLANWGDPQTPSLFWAVIRGEAYADRLQLNHIPIFLGAVWRTLGQNLGFVGILLTAFGLAQWWEDKRPLFIASLIIITLNILWVASYNSADILPYLYPTLIITILAISHALNQIAIIINQKANPNKYYSKLATLALGIVLIASPAWQSWGQVTQASTDADDYGRIIAQQLPKNSIIFTFDTQTTFALHYALTTSPPRSDITAINDPLRAWDWYRNDLQHFYPDLQSPAHFTPLDDLIDQLPIDRPLYATHLTTSRHIFIYNNDLDIWHITKAE